MLGIVVHIVAKPAGQRGFVVHPRRWVVERTLGWLMAHRRLVRDYERDPAISEGLVRWAAIYQMVCRIARGRPAKRSGSRSIESFRRRERAVSLTDEQVTIRANTVLGEVARENQGRS